MLLNLRYLTFDALSVPVYLVDFDAPAPSHDYLAAMRLRVALQTYLFASLIVFCVNYGDRLDAVHDVFVLFLDN